MTEIISIADCCSAALTRRGWLHAVSAAVFAAGGVGVSNVAASNERRQVKQLSPRDVQKKLIVHEKSPHNAEPALADLLGGWITPVEHFYVRSHAPIPEVDLKLFRVVVDGLVERPLELSVAELSDLPQVESTATLTCAGNRRSEHNAFRKVKGVQWRAGAIGNAEWRGVPLSAILKKAGVKSEAKHVWFESVDKIEKDGGTIPFGASIPLEKARSDGGPDAPSPPIVALEMNGEPLAPDHGFPVRMVVPGYIGARSVKWLGRITVSDRPSPNHYVQTAYKVVTEDAPLAWAEAGPIYAFPLNAVVCDPASGAKLTPGKVTVRGYALPPGGRRTIAKVELSTDGGRTWQPAKITTKNQPDCWTLWRSEIPVAANTNQLIVRATDSAGFVQPPLTPWNLKGYLFNAQHRVTVNGGWTHPQRKCFA